MQNKATRFYPKSRDSRQSKNSQDSREKRKDKNEKDKNVKKILGGAANIGLEIKYIINYTA